MKWIIRNTIILLRSKVLLLDNKTIPNHGKYALQMNNMFYFLFIQLVIGDAHCKSTSLIICNRRHTLPERVDYYRKQFLCSKCRGIPVPITENSCMRVAYKYVSLPTLAGCGRECAAPRASWAPAVVHAHR
jgi:hypothetical protein